MRLPKSAWLLGIICGLLLVLFSEHGPALAQRLVVGQEADPVTLDPQRMNDVRSMQVLSQIYETLIDQGEDLQLYPGLAESWEQVDERTWQFRLRQDVTFHNGEPLTARDVQFTLERLRDPATGSPAAFLLDVVDAVEVMDDFTVRLRLERPFAPILSHLAHQATAIVNEKAVREAGDDYGTRVWWGRVPTSLIHR